MSRSNRILFSNTSLPAGATNGSWYQIRHDEHSHRAVNVEITGTVTVTLVGRNDSAEAGTTVKQVNTSEAFQIAHTPHLRVLITGATAGASVKVSVDGAALLEA